MPVAADEPVVAEARLEGGVVGFEELVVVEDGGGGAAAGSWGAGASAGGGPFGGHSYGKRGSDLSRLSEMAVLGTDAWRLEILSVSRRARFDIKP